MKKIQDGRHDFDFYHGRWKIGNRRLEKRLIGNTNWQEFEATQTCNPVIGGMGNLDNFSGTFPDGQAIEGMTLRIFSPTSKLWSIYWTDNRCCELQPPVLGRFENGRGTFHGDDTLNDKPIKVVFYWYDITPNSATWEQAFSEDNGATWETNWQMFMTREQE
jgi:hypothetical protein